MPIDPKLMAILACPACDDRPPLVEEADALVCERCGTRYPVMDGIPNLTVPGLLAAPPAVEEQA